MNVFCLFCQTQQCKRIASRLEDRGVQRAFSPQIVKRERRQGRLEDLRYDLLPGYVFVFDEKPIMDGRLLEGISGIIRRLGDPDKGWMLEGSDKEFALELLKKDGVVEPIQLCVGDTVQLLDALFNGCEGQVTRLDLRKQRCRVDFMFNKMPCHTWIACDLVEKRE